MLAHTTDNPKLKMRPIKKGAMQSLFLAYYNGTIEYVDETTGEIKRKADRHEVSINLELYTYPTTPTEKEHNRQTEIQAEIMREQARQMYLNGKGFTFDVRKRSGNNFYDWLEHYKTTYAKADYRTAWFAIDGFKKYIGESKQYSLLYSAVIKPEDVTRDMMKGYAAHLMATHNGEGAPTYWQRFHKAIKVAVEEGVLATDLCEGIVVRVDKVTKKDKNVLTIVEQEQLLRCQPECINPDIRRAFQLTLLFSPAYCDVRALTWDNIKMVDGRPRLQYRRKKTNVAVDVELDSETFAMLGNRGKSTDRLFPQLPSSNEGANKTLNKWVRLAGINKHITWYSGRHSFCTTSMELTNDPIATAAIAGHSNPSITLNVYSHEVESKKQALTKARRDAKGTPKATATTIPSIEGMTPAQLVEQITMMQAQLLKMMQEGK